MHWLVTGVPLKGNMKSWGMARCNVKLVPLSPVYKGSYANLGIGKCQMRGGKPGEKYFPGLGEAGCRERCNKMQTCGGYGVGQFDKPHCMLYLRPYGKSLSGGGGWDKRVPKASCLVKLVPGQIDFKSRTTIEGTPEPCKFEDGTDCDSGDDMSKYRRRRTTKPAPPPEEEQDN